MRPLRVFAAFAFLLVFVTACATLQSQSKEEQIYRLMATSAQTYDTGMRTVAQLYNEGVIGPDEVRTAAQVGRAFWSAWHETMLFVQIWMATKDYQNEQKLAAVIEQFTQRYNEFLQFIQPLLERKVVK